MARISRARVRGGAERRAPPADRPARAGWAALRQFLFREFFLEIFPATLVSRATRNQTDPLAPLGRRCGCWPPSPFLEFGLGAGAAAAAPDSMVWSAAPGERSEVRGLRQRPARNRTDTRAAFALARATGGTERSAEKGPRSPLWRVFPARAREAEPSDALRQQTDPLEPAGRRFANFFLESSF